MHWYYSVEGESVGPISEEELHALAAKGSIAPETLVWHDGMEEWAAYSSVDKSGATQAETIAAVEADSGNCVECGKEFPLNDMLEYEGSTICAACKPVYFQRVQEGVALPGIFEYAGFGVRFAAKFLDGLILGAVNVAIVMISGALGFSAGAMENPEAGMGAMMIVQVVMSIVQICVQVMFTVFFLGKYGATPGKMACKIKVIRSDGSKITYGRACGRYFGEMLSQMTFYIGYLMVAWDDEKRSLHDRICDTRVIKAE